MARASNLTMCSFCGKSHAEVKKLIAGPGVYICDGCINVCRGILEKEGKDFSASMAGKVKMTLQCVAVTVSLLSLATSLHWPWLPGVRDVCLWLAVGVTVWSGLIYVIRGFSLLRQE